MPGGVSSPVRSFSAVGGTPPFIVSATGCRMTDAEGKSYIDYVGSYGPLIAGHAHPKVVAAITTAAANGTCYGAPTPCEVDLAELILSAFPAVADGMIRFVNSGTEAVMSALRLARAATGRTHVVKCIGCYHGHVDGLLAQAGSGLLTLSDGARASEPSSAGVPAELVRTTLLVPYNDLHAAEALFGAHGRDIACFAVEPIAGNMGLIEPAPGYLAGLRRLCDQYGALLLFDEVMTGFRVAWGGAQTLYGVRPDITTLGKVIGGGVPVGAYMAPGHLMKQIAPLGPVYQAGTLSGNPLAMAAGLATLGIMREAGAYEALAGVTGSLAEGLRAVAAETGTAITVNHVCGMITPFFSAGPVDTYPAATASDTRRFASVFHRLLAGGVNVPPSQFEAWFPSLAHTPADIAETVGTFRAALTATRP